MIRHPFQEWDRSSTGDGDGFRHACKCKCFPLISFPRYKDSRVGVETSHFNFLQVRISQTDGRNHCHFHIFRFLFSQKFIFNLDMAPSALLLDPEPEYVVVHAGKGTIKREILKGDKKKPTFETITQVDFSKMNSSSFADRKEIAKEIGAAFRDSGFLYAANHGISEELQEHVYSVIKEFFELPLEEKMKVFLIVWKLRRHRER